MLKYGKYCTKMPEAQNYVSFSIFIMEMFSVTNMNYERYDLLDFWDARASIVIQCACFSNTSYHKMRKVLCSEKFCEVKIIFKFRKQNRVSSVLVPFSLSTIVLHHLWFLYFSRQSFFQLGNYIQ